MAFSGMEVGSVIVLFEADKALPRLSDVLDLDVDMTISLNELRELFGQDFDKRFTHIDTNRDQRVDLLELRCSLQHTNGTFNLQRIRELMDKAVSMKQTPQKRKSGLQMVHQQTITVDENSIFTNMEGLDPELIRAALLRGGLGLSDMEPEMCPELHLLCDLIDDNYELLFSDEDQWDSFPDKVQGVFSTQRDSENTKVNRQLLMKVFNDNLGTVLGIRKCIESILETMFLKDFKQLCGMLLELDPRDSMKDFLWFLPKNAAKLISSFGDTMKDRTTLKNVFKLADGTFDLRQIRTLCHVLENRVPHIEVPAREKSPIEKMPVESMKELERSETDDLLPEFEMRELSQLLHRRVTVVDQTEESPTDTSSKSLDQLRHIRSMQNVLDIYGISDAEEDETDLRARSGLHELCELLDTHYEFLFIDDFNHTSFFLLPDEIKPVFELIQNPESRKVNRQVLADSLNEDESMIEEIKKRIQTTVIHHFDHRFLQICDTIDFDFDSLSDIKWQELEWIFATQQAREFVTNTNINGGKLDRADFRDLFALPDGTYDISRLQKLSDLVLQSKEKEQKKRRVMTREELREFLISCGVGCRDLGDDFRVMCDILDEHYEFLFIDGDARLWNTFSEDVGDEFQKFHRSSVRKIDRSSLAKALSKQPNAVTENVKKRIEAFVLL